MTAVQMAHPLRAQGADLRTAKGLAAKSSSKPLN